MINSVSREHFRECIATESERGNQHILTRIEAIHERMRADD